MSTEDMVADALLAAVRASQQTYDAVPEDVVAAAKASYTWLTVDAEFAQLADDTAEAPLAGVRGVVAPRLLTFTADDTVVVVEVRAAGAGRMLLGEVVGTPVERVEVRSPGGTTSVACDEYGRFVASGVPAGPMSLKYTPRERPTPLVTAWVTV